MIKLFKNGKELCEVKEYKPSEGKQETNHFKPVGRLPRTRIPILGKKDMDRITFVVPICLDIHSEYELRDDKGKVGNIIIERRNTKPEHNQFFVEAVIY